MTDGLGSQKRTAEEKEEPTATVFSLKKKFQNVYENFENREERQKLPKRDYFSNKVA